MVEILSTWAQLGNNATKVDFTCPLLWLLNFSSITDGGNDDKAWCEWFAIDSLNEFLLIVEESTTAFLGITATTEAPEGPEENVTTTTMEIQSTTTSPEG